MPISPNQSSTLWPSPLAGHLARRQYKVQEFYHCFCPSVSQEVRDILDLGQCIHICWWKICSSQPLLCDNQIVSTSVESPYPYPLPTLSSKALYWNFLIIFCLWESVNGISSALISWLKYHTNSGLSWVDEFTVLVNLFCWKSQIWFRNDFVHCDRNKNSLLIKI